MTHLVLQFLRKEEKTRLWKKGKTCITRLKKETKIVEEIISLNHVHDYNRDMFALRYPLNINYRSFEILVMCEQWFLRKSYRVEIVL